MVNRRVAVLVADSHADVFQAIKREIHPEIWNFAALNNIDVYYMLGREPSFAETALVKLSDQFRYTKLHPVQRVVDFTQLFRHNFNLPSVQHESGTLHVDIPEGLRYLGVKYLASLKYLYEKNYDIVYKTTLSSILNPAKFINFVKSLSLTEPIYVGTQIIFPEVRFISGANLFLNRKSIELILQNKKRWNHALLDDVAISRLLWNVQSTPLSSMNISSTSQAQSITEQQISETFHYRCRTAGPIRNDLDVMKILYARICQK